MKNKVVYKDNLVAKIELNENQNFIIDLADLEYISSFKNKWVLKDDVIFMTERSKEEKDKNGHGKKKRYNLKKQLRILHNFFPEIEKIPMSAKNNNYLDLRWKNLYRGKPFVANAYVVIDNYAYIKLNNSDEEVVIDVKFLKIVLNYGKWFVHSSKNKLSVITKGREEMNTYPIGLKILVLNLEYGENNFRNPILEDRNPFNLITENININKHYFTKNEYNTRDQQFSELIIYNDEGNIKQKILIDSEDVERAINKGRWYSQKHQDFQQEIVMAKLYEDNTVSTPTGTLLLHRFITSEYDSKKQVYFKNGNTYDCRKSNILIRGEIGSWHNNPLFLRKDNYGEYYEFDIYSNDQIFTVKFDKNDYKKIAKGYSWQITSSSSYSYSRYVLYNNNNRINYMHRIIMNTKDGEIVDHIDHDTTNNRKYNLKICNVSENMMNRLSYRKEAKSEHRGVSWDSKNRDWIVNIQGQYYLRTKDLELANNKADEIYEELGYVFHIES